MIVAGAGGHALEIFDVLLSLGFNEESIYFYDDYSSKIKIFNCTVLKSEVELKHHLKLGKEFCLGIGNPHLRKKFYELMTRSGGIHYPVISPYAIVSKFAVNHGSDILANCFVSSNSVLGLGTLINTSANIHHEVKIGDFNEISPAAVILGGVQTGDFCKIGSNATILPKINLANDVTVGAGAVVVNHVIQGKVVKGVPAK